MEKDKWDQRRSDKCIELSYAEGPSNAKEIMESPQWKSVISDLYKGRNLTYLLRLQPEEVFGFDFNEIMDVNQCFSDGGGLHIIGSDMLLASSFEHLIELHPNTRSFCYCSKLF